MYWHIDHYVLIGTLKGGGYNCYNGGIDKFPKKVGIEVGTWNKVSHWVDWIRGQMKIMGEEMCMPG